MNNNSLFYNHIEENDINRQVINEIAKYAEENRHQQIYLLTAPLGEKYHYQYEKDVIVILSPKHKIIFLDLSNNGKDFEIFYEDFVEDLNSISDKYNYKEHIGRPRDWKREITAKEVINTEFDVDDLFEKHKLSNDLQRKCELLISLLIGSINDIEKIGAEVPATLLEKVKRNIILFDGDQTRFIYKDFHNKTVAIQGLSGTGKTELLLHKLKELYISDDNSKIFFTCHNIALANTLKERIPSFFNFMKVEKQIEWNSRLWVDRAWGTQKDKNSGLYSYLCHFYNVPFLRYSPITDYERIFNQVFEHINQIEEDEFEFAFDYILIDERQDFPKVFFELCEKIAREKVYVAGDIFQDIFENTKDTELEVDVILNRCYRTDPRTLMFAHAIGMGLFEEKKLNWFEDKYWEAIGYNMTRHKGRELHLSREPIRRFEDLDLSNTQSMIIEGQGSTHTTHILRILKNIQSENPTVSPSDIAIIILDDNRRIYEYIDSLCYSINEQLGWKVNRAYESKTKEENSLYITNPNNVKGLEFPFVICVTAYIKDSYRYRNILYTMLTRSFIQSYLLVENNHGLKFQQEGLETINEKRYIKTIEPTGEEKEEIRKTLITLHSESSMSYKEFLNLIFRELKIKTSCREKLEKALLQAEIEKFDKDKTIKFINANKEFYCK
ncbi:DEAD/DEAH box helicase [Prolixibacter sp. NT017]|uniref:DEAD/DEAH box helicase n=1 Tax=Prolixibacter sp. NT017 TaxID=2652390 RepID=UPI0012779988|nr:ATP-binding domain-containing protein [Prolixibacter sp. NT017]GET25509.1 DNA helicase [Prolixibacter sp. NT017]